MSLAAVPAERVRALIGAQVSTTSATGTTDILARLCRAAALALPAMGVAASVMTDTGVFATAASSDPDTSLLAELQFTLGEGPCVDAFAAGSPVLVPDLAESVARWPGYATAALDRGVRSVFAFPLQVGAARLGALDVFCDEPRPLPAKALNLALTFAEVATATVLDGQAGSLTGPIPTDFDDALTSQFHIHQAQGMLTVQLGVSLVEALARLRAYAYASDRRLADVATDVVQRRLILARDLP